MDVAHGFKDGEADMYYYNFSNFSGKFFLDQDGKAWTIPVTNLKIVNYPFWTITGDDGTIYTFSKEESVNSTLCPNGDVINRTAWYLSNIKSADGRSEIAFTYQPVSYTFFALLGETKYIPMSSSQGVCRQNQNCVGSHKHDTHRLQRIDFRDGYLQFNYYNTRCDLVDDKSLDEIELYTKSGLLVRKFSMAYGYFGNNSDGANRLTEIDKRLKLISVTEQNLGSAKPPYKFEYNEAIALPSRLSYAQDHWGFFNGKTSNFGLVATYAEASPSGGLIISPGADRRTDPTKAQAAVLTKITYPTGGQTLFTFESNTVDDDVVEPQTTDAYLSLSATNYPV